MAKAKAKAAPKLVKCQPCGGTGRLASHRGEVMCQPCGGTGKTSPEVAKDIANEAERPRPRMPADLMA